MTKRRMASIWMTGKKKSLKYPVNVVAVASGTGTATGAHIFTVVASNEQVYLNTDSSTNAATLVGTGTT